MVKTDTSSQCRKFPTKVSETRNSVKNGTHVVVMVMGTLGESERSNGIIET